MGGFLIGLAIEKWNLHRRIALNIVQFTGTSGNRIVLGFIISTGLISMWLSNTATTMMMFPIALSVIHVMKENHPEQQRIQNFSLTIMLAIAFASNFGGVATLIGTPPNVAYAAYILKKIRLGHWLSRLDDYLYAAFYFAFIYSLLGDGKMALSKWYEGRCHNKTNDPQRSE